MPRRRRMLLLAVIVVVALAILALVALVLRGDPEHDGASAPRGDPGTHAGAGTAGDDDTSASDASAAAAPRQLGTIGGRVRRRDDGAPAEVVEVRLRGSGGVLTATTDGQGRFEISGVPRGERFDLEVSVRGFGPLVRRGIRLGRHRRLDLGTLWLTAGAKAEIVVRDVGGEGVRNAVVEAFLAGDGATPFEAGAVPVPVATARTDGDGVARFGRLAADTWAFVARAGGRERRSTGPVALHGGAGTQRFLVTLGPGADLTGFVRGPDRQALAGVEIVALRRTIIADEGTAPLAVRSVSRSDGAYELRGLPVGDVVLWCAREGEPLAAVAAVSVPTVGRLDLLLPQSSRLVGRLVQSESGEPLADAVVHARFHLPLGIPTMVSTVSDERGQFELRFPGRGVIGELDVEAPGMFATRDGVAPDLQMQVDEGDTVEVTLTMVAGVRLTGVVTSDGTPVADATIVAQHPHETREATTDHDGVYAFEALRPGTVTLFAARWGHVGAEASVQVPADRGGGGVVQDFALERGGNVTGVVVGTSGVPIAGASVHVLDEPRALAAESGSEGRFEIGPLSPGQQWLEVQHAEHSPGYAQVVAPGGSARIQLAPLRRVHGRVTDTAGRPIPGAIVRAAGTDGSVSDPMTEDWGWLTMDRFAVGGDGSFDHGVAIVESHFRVRAEAPGYAPAVVEGGPGPLRILLNRGATLAGFVVGAGGRALAGAWVGVTRIADDVDPGAVAYPGAWGPPVRAVTDARGRFEIPGLTEDRYLVMVRVDGSWAARAAADAPDTSVRIEVPGTDAE